MRDDELLELLGQLDPARSEEPPAPGSSRYTAIKEQAMSTNLSTNITPVEESAPGTDPIPAAPPSSPPHRRWRYVAAAAAAVVVVAGTVVLRPGNERSAEATIAAAADELAQVTSLRSDMRFDNVAFGEGETTIAVSGHDHESRSEISTDGGTESPRFVVVDNIEYYTDSTGRTTAEPFNGYDDEDGSFGESSAAVVTAVLEDADVDEVGSEEVRGAEATHYRLQLADAGESALAALSDKQQDWFGLIIGDGGLNGNATVDIWVADGLVRRFEISSPDYGSQSVEFYDFNADITITPPPGPYAESSAD
jgi:hypothetical protein